MEQNTAVMIPKIELNPIKEKPKNKFKLKLPVILIIFSLVLVVALSFLPIYFFSLRVNRFVNNLEKVSSEFDINNTTKLRENINYIDSEINNLSKTYTLFSWMKIIPYLGKYVDDLGHSLTAGKLLVKAGTATLQVIEPYLETLGFKEGKDSGQTSQERIDFIIKSIPELLPRMDEIILDITRAEEHFSQIDPSDYPEKYKNIELREELRKAFDLFESISKYVSQSKPLLEVVPYLLGVDDERNYLVLFQNDKELRPTGGFLTAYSVMKVKNAKFEPVSSDDIYNLDAKYKPIYEAPEPFIDLIKGPYILSKNIRLRDMNYSADFKLAMDMFSEEVKKVGIKEIDGIIAVDTQLLVNLLDALGEIGVSGFGNFSTKTEPKCNCPQVIYELESFADIEGPIIWDPLTGKIILRPPNSDNRKKIIGPLMNSILANAFGATKEKMPKLVDAVFKSVTEKHVIFYMFDTKAQKAVDDFGIAGTIRSSDSDYLHINNSNLGGRKSNLYVKEEIEQEINQKKDGTIEKTVTITYKNSEKHDGWLNSVLPNWVRVYVPEGSRLIEVQGLEKEYETKTEFGKTVFSGYFRLRPEGMSKVVFKYSLPIKKSNDFRIFIQKQPGIDAPLYRIITSKSEEEFLLKTDKEIRIKL